ncbi:MAG: TetR/AcrR family transcriptional regulator [Clostridium sp.]|uniref:TetR/AcrR family transcriptional regulator n=1 Tax=Clostridium sp. TaxID=1506 RepID=UPI003EE7CC36
MKTNLITTKKNLVLDISITEFALHGYKGTSTNIICKKSSISKGLLYHYFTSKENLYRETLQYAINIFKANITLDFSNNKKGIDYISEYFNLKFKFFSENPLISKIIIGSFLNTSIDGVSEIFSEFESYNNSLIYAILDSISINSKFDKFKAFELIILISEKLEEKHLKNIPNESPDILVENFRREHKLMLEMVFCGIDN